jgi:hypothetical protein
MAGWGAFAGFLMEIINKFVPSRKAALVDELKRLNAEYEKALKEGRDTDAAILRKQMEELRKKADFTDGDV